MSLQELKPKETGTDIVAAVTSNPALVLLKPETFDDLYAHIKAEADALEIDLTTEKGRGAIRSLAHKIARTKTAIDAAGKKLNEEARAKINAVDGERKKVRERLDALKDEVRRPLTEWEDAEKARQEWVASLTACLERDACVLAEDTSETLADRLASVRAVEITTEKFGEDAEPLAVRRTQTVATLEAAITRAKQAEAERAELERLRREEEERKEREAEAARQREAEEAERKRQAEEAERQRQRDEELRRQAAEDAARKVREEAEARAAKERAEAEERERAAREEIERLRHENEEREAKERAEREAEEKRQRDRQHRDRIKGEAMDALTSLGAEDALAEKIVLAIIAGEVPHISLRF